MIKIINYIAKFSKLLTSLSMLMLALAAIFMTINPGYGFAEFVPSFQAEVLANYAYGLLVIALIVYSLPRTSK